MQCQEVRDLLSAYYDDELSAELKTQVTFHVDSCSACSAELACFRGLTQSAGQLHHPEPPNAIWAGIEAGIESQFGDNDKEASINRLPQFARQEKKLLRATAIAALLLVSVGMGIFGRQKWLGHRHNELAADFSNYLDAFQVDPNDAHLVLIDKYAGQPVNISTAHAQLGYQPALASGLPDGYTIRTAYVMDMPCCKCIKCVCNRRDGSTLAVFEHNDEQPIWFEGRPSIQTECGGEACTLTQLDCHLAVSWKRNARNFTIVGARDVEEAGIFIKHLAI